MDLKPNKHMLIGAFRKQNNSKEVHISVSVWFLTICIKEQTNKKTSFMYSMSLALYINKSLQKHVYLIIIVTFVAHE